MDRSKFLSDFSIGVMLSSDNAHDRADAIVQIVTSNNLGWINQMGELIVSDPSEKVAEYCILALSSMGPPGIKVLGEMLRPDVTVRRLYSITRSLMTRRDCSAKDAVAELLFKDDWFLQIAAIRYLIRCDRDASKYYAHLKQLAFDLNKLSFPVYPDERGVPLNMVFVSKRQAEKVLKKTRRVANRWRRTSWLI